MTILIVDDEVVVRNVMLTVLLRAGYRVLEADSAAEALRLADTFEDAIDLLIADHSLKTMSGRQVAEKICRSRPGLKVLQISGFAPQQLEAEGALLPRAHFLGKPFLPKSLIEEVRAILG